MSRPHARTDPRSARAPTNWKVPAAHVRCSHTDAAPQPAHRKFLTDARELARTLVRRVAGRQAGALRAGRHRGALLSRSPRGGGRGGPPKNAGGRPPRRPPPPAPPPPIPDP